MSDGDNPFLQPGGWTLNDSTNPDFYPAGNNLVIGRNQSGTDFFDLVWTEASGAICYLEKTQYFAGVPGGPPASLFSESCTGYDPDGSQHTYSVWVALTAGGGQINAAVTEAVSPAAADGGSLAGLWGADAKPSVPTIVPEIAPKSLKAVR